MTLKDQIAVWLKGYEKLAILGIGNPQRGDDAVGMEIVKMLKRKVTKNVKLIECETVPENFLSEIEQFSPTHVLMIDAAHFKAQPGRAKIISPEEIAATAVSTHMLPLSLMAEVIKRSLNAKVMLLGVQPKNTEFVESLSPELRKASEEIAEIISDATNH